MLSLNVGAYYSTGADLQLLQFIVYFTQIGTKKTLRALLSSRLYHVFYQISNWINRLLGFMFSLETNRFRNKFGYFRFVNRFVFILPL
jgi:hypothetical protein